MRNALIVVLALVLGGCGRDVTAPYGIDGSYTLVSAYGQPLPATLDLGNGRTLTVRSGAIDLHGGTYSGTARASADGSAFDQPFSGSYAVAIDGRTLAMADAAVMGGAGTCDGASLTIQWAGGPWVYRRH